MAKVCIILCSIIITVMAADEETPQHCGPCLYTPWIGDAVCTNLTLSNPPVQCSEARVLELNYNNIYGLNENAFTIFVNLQQFNLENNPLRHIHPNAFVGNTKIWYINLQENLLTNVANLTFTGVPNLKELYLNKNQISVVEVQAFQGLFKLEVLHISNNNLTVITQESLSMLKKLRYLYMANNHLKVLQNETFLDLENLLYLDLNFNRITIIEPNAFKGLVGLAVLKVAQNNIASTGFIALLPTHQLNLLNISGNRITTISSSTNIFQSLNKIYVEDNPFVCDADLKSLISWYHRHDPSVISDDPVCEKPDCLKDQKLKEIPLEYEFNCDSLVSPGLQNPIAETEDVPEKAQEIPPSKMPEETPPRAKMPEETPPRGKMPNETLSSGKIPEETPTSSKMPEKTPPTSSKLLETILGIVFGALGLGLLLFWLYSLYSKKKIHPRLFNISKNFQHVYQPVKFKQPSTLTLPISQSEQATDFHDESV